MKYILEERREYKGYPLIIFSTVQGPHGVIHSHDFIEMGLVRRGHSTHVLYEEEKEFPYGLIRGDFFIIMPDELHNHCDNEDFFFYNVAFKPEVIASFLPELETLESWNELFHPKPLFQRKCLHLLPGKYEHAEKLLKRMMYELHLMSGCDYHRLNARNSFLDYLTLLGSTSPQEWKQTPQSIDPRILDVVNSLENDPSRPFHLPALAKMAGLSQSGLAKKFKAAMGVSPLDYCISLRMESVRKLLLETDHSIGEIAFRTGFCDSNYLVKMFHRQYGIPPARYRRSFRNHSFS